MNETFIERMRKKPPHVRERILWLTVIPVWLVIFVFWVGALFGSSGGDTAGNLASGSASPVSALVSAVGTVGSSFRDEFSANVEQFKRQSEALMGTSTLDGQVGLPVGAEILGEFEDQSADHKSMGTSSDILDSNATTTYGE